MLGLRIKSQQKALSKLWGIRLMQPHTEGWYSARSVSGTEDRVMLKVGSAGQSASDGFAIERRAYAAAGSTNDQAART
jgi:hypothetical protein